MKVKYVITVPVIDEVPEGEKPLKKKAVLEAVAVTLADDARVTLGKVKIAEV